MDAATTREHVEKHAVAVERGDMDAVVADFSKDLRPQVPQITQALPQPVTAADVLSVEVGDAESVALIRYSGGTGEVTIRSRWQDGTPGDRGRRARGLDDDLFSDESEQTLHSAAFLR